MADRASGPRAPADAKLLEQVRAGDTSAFGVLYERHVRAVQRLARELVVSPAEADHLVAETFGLVHDVTRGGGGPADAFRPYLLAALGRVAAGRVGDRRVPAAGDPGPGEPLALIPDDAHVARAFLSLPEHTRAVLWHTEIEQGTPAAVAPMLGASPNGVATERRRARESLRQAIISTHAAGLSRPECQQAAEHLGDYQRGVLPAGESAAVADHLNRCDDCSAVIAALGDVTSALRDQVAPLYLGGATTAYLLGARRADPRGSGAADSGDTREMPVAAGAAPGWRLRRAWVAAGAALAVGATAAVLALTGHAAPPRAAGNSQADAMPSVEGTTSSGSAHTPAPARSGRHSSAAHPAPSRVPRPKPSTSGPKTSPTPARAPKTSAPASTPAPAVVLAASVSVQQAMGLNEVAFQVSDSGTAATVGLTATITLPAGSWLLGLVHGHGGAGGWSCQPTSTGASCQHGAISAGAEASGTILIGAAGPACGQSAQLSAASGTASATAQSATDIQCGG